MEADKPSLTAQLVAMMRAAHQVLDRPRVFDDPIALAILGEQALAEINTSPDSFGSGFALSLRAFLVARSRYAEDLLARAVDRGVRQYVILGAGLDTFPYRNPFPPDALRVFEVDYPSTQAWKRERLDAAGIGIPASLRFAAVDFETQELAAQLWQVGFRPEQPAFFSWLGVTMYLTAADVRRTLRSIAKFAAPGSGIVFDYALSPTLMSPQEVADFSASAARVASLGEPWKSSFDPVALAADLEDAGFQVDEDLDGAAINALFFSGRDDDLRVNRRAHFMSAALPA